MTRHNRKLDPQAAGHSPNPGLIPPPFPGCKAVIIGASAGGTRVLRQIIAGIERNYPLPLVLVQHLHPDDDDLLVDNLQRELVIPVVSILDKMPLQPGRLHVAPADYHLLMEQGGKLALSIDEPVHWSRPSIDLFFKSAARAMGDRLCAILLTGANADGADGLRQVHDHGGRTLVQDPDSAEFPVMPRAAIERGGAQWVLPPRLIASTLHNLGREVNHG